MEAGSASSSVSSPPRSVEVVIRDLKNDVRVLQDQVEAIDTEGGRCLENMDKDLVYLWKTNQSQSEEGRECSHWFDSVIGNQG